jgi:hypothetical protein
MIPGEKYQYCKFGPILGPQMNGHTMIPVENINIVIFGPFLEP